MHPCAFLFFLSFSHSQDVFNFADGLVASLVNGKRSNYKDDDNPQGGKRMRFSGPDLPEVRVHNADNKPFMQIAHPCVAKENNSLQWEMLNNFTVFT